MTKRELKIVPTPASTLLHIEWEGGGELPDMLKGDYTTPAEANIAIARWKSTKTPVEEVALMKKDDENKAVAQK